MLKKKQVLLFVFTILFCSITALGVIAGLNFNLVPTVTCPDDGETFTHFLIKNGDGEVFHDYWKPELPKYAQTHIESTVTGFGLVTVSFTGTVAGFTGKAPSSGEVGSVGTFLGYPTSRSVHNLPVVGSVMELFPTNDGEHNWSGEGGISLTPWEWSPSSSGLWSWGGSWVKGEKVTSTDAGEGNWTIKTVEDTVILKPKPNNQEANSPTGISVANSEQTFQPGDSVTLNLVTTEPYYDISWYVHEPWNTNSSGTYQQNNSGDGTSTEASLSYTFPSGSMHTGDFLFRAVIYRWSDMSWHGEETYTITVE